MNVYDAIMKRRTIRKFEQKAVSEDNLVKLVDCARGGIRRECSAA